MSARQKDHTLYSTRLSVIEHLKFVPKVDGSTTTRNGQFATPTTGNAITRNKSDWSITELVQCWNQRRCNPPGCPDMSGRPRAATRILSRPKPDLMELRPLRNGNGPRFCCPGGPTHQFPTPMVGTTLV